MYKPREEIQKSAIIYAAATVRIALPTEKW